MDIQAEHAAWLATRYPDQPADIPAAGMVEEAGELLHCFVVEKRVLLYGSETRVRDLVAELYDALGDCAIYFCSYCNSKGIKWKLAEFMEVASVDRMHRDDMAIAVDLVRIAGEFYATRSRQYAVAFVGTLKRIALDRGWELERIVDTIWVGVRDRCK